MNSFTALSIITLILFCVSSCGEPEGAPLTEQEKEEYMNKGRAVTLIASTTLMSRLSKALSEGDVAHAIEYCNTVAVPLIDSISRAHGATVKRTSQRIRNPQNKPEKHEEVVLQGYKQQESAGAELMPYVKPLGEDRVAFYAPIRINGLCLNCHGVTGKDVTEENAALLEKLYPGDEATWYHDGDLRGIWSISFRRK